MTPGLINLLPNDISQVDLSPYNVIYALEIKTPITDETWEKFSESFDIEELNHEYKVYRLTRK